MFEKDLLKEKIILVTGGGSGLGLVMAKRFAELGASIAICGRTEEKLLKASREIASTSERVATKTVDVRDYEAVGQMFDELESDFGAIDGLVNNAAGNFLCPSEDLSENAFKTVVDIVLGGTFNCSNHFGKKLIAAKQPGSILNIVTTYVDSGSSFVLPSACAKAGVATMTKTLAYEWATYGIRSNAIAPGPFPTEGAWKRLIPDADFEEIYKKRLPIKRFGKPEELANLASYIMSDGAAYMNGEIVTIDGGESLTGGQFNFLAEMMPRDKLKAVFSSMRKKS